MTSDEETNSKKPDRKEKRFKKLVEPPKSPKAPKSKRSHFIIKKLKLKSKSVPDSSSRSVSSAPEDLSPPEASPESFVLEKQTSEGDDDFVLTKSVSETNLKETWRSVENLKEDIIVESAGSGEKDQLVLQKVLPERTKSLDNLKDMLTYGELIMDRAAETVKTFTFFCCRVVNRKSV